MKFFFSSRRACLAAFEISLALFISGCAIYKTPELPNDQLATIVVADKDRHHELTIESVDGATNLRSCEGQIPLLKFCKELKIQSGKRSIVIGYYTYDGSVRRSGKAKLVFEAQAGRLYTAHVRSIEGGTMFSTRVTDDQGYSVKLLKNE
jgi:hypothetical protein